MKKEVVIITSVLVIMIAFASGEAVDIQGTPILEYSMETVEEIEEDNEVEFESEYDFYCWLVGYSAELSGVNPELAIAISRLETGNWTSDAFINGHNFGGLTGEKGVYSYKRETDGLEAYMKCLSWYQEKGMDTPKKMQKVYCPNNPKWADRVEEIMREIK